MPVSDDRAPTGDGHREHGKRAARTHCHRRVPGRLGHQMPVAGRQSELGRAGKAREVAEREPIRNVRTSKEEERAGGNACRQCYRPAVLNLLCASFAHLSLNSGFYKHQSCISNYLPFSDRSN